MSERHEAALAALLADVGAIALRAGEALPGDAGTVSIARESAIGGGGPLAPEAAFAALFLARCFPGEAWTLAAGEAKSGGTMARVVYTARRAAHGASALSRSVADEAGASRERLAPVWARVRPGGGAARGDAMHLPLRPLSFRSGELDPAAGEGPTSATRARDEYAHGIWDALEAGITRIAKNRGEGAPVTDRVLHAAHALVERLCARVPAGTDVPVAACAHVAAAIAAALWAECVEGHESTRSATDDLGRADVPRFVWFAAQVCGGEALFEGLSEATGPEVLAARALWPSVVADAVASRLFAALELPPTSLLHIARGRFTALLPLRLHAQAEAAIAEAEVALADLDASALSIAWGAVPLALADFDGARLSAAQQALAHEVAQSENRPFGSLLARTHGHEALFAPRPAPVGESSAGSLARTAALGEMATRSVAIARVPFAAQARADKSLREAGARTLPSVGLGPLGVAYLGLSQVPVRPLAQNDDEVLLAQSPDVSRDLEASVLAGMRAPWLPPPRRGGGAPCATLATTAKGAKRWGVLVAEIADLQKLVRIGLPEGERTFVRALELERAAHRFTAGFAATLAVRDDAVHVFDAGDARIGAVGPWDHLPGLALALRDAWHRFSGGNPNVGMLAAIGTGDERAGVGDVIAGVLHGLSRARATARRHDGCSMGGAVLSWGDVALVAEFAHALVEVPVEGRKDALLHVGRIARTGALAEAIESRGRSGGSAMRRAGRAWRSLVAIEACASRAGETRALLQRVATTLATGHVEGVSLERNDRAGASEGAWAAAPAPIAHAADADTAGSQHEAIEKVWGVAAEWCRLLSDDGGQP
jgi:hypothetical protein